MQEPRERIERLSEERGLLSLWFVLLAGPAAWMMGLMVDYSLVRVACTDGAVVALHLVTATTLGVVVAGGLVGRREWRLAGERWPGEGGGDLTRSRFMIAVGLMASGFFTLVILAQWLAKLFLHPCMGI